MNKFITKEGNLKYQSVKNLLTTTNELWRKVNQIATECGIPTANFLKPGEDPIKETRKIYTPSDIVFKVNRKFKVNVKQKSRLRNNSDAKIAVCFLLKRYTRLSLRQIAGYIGNKEHTSVMSNLKSYQRLIDTDTQFKEFMNDLIYTIEAVKSID